MIDPKLIKELRAKTQAGFLDVKKALEACANDLQKAIKWLQEKGMAKAAKKADNIAAEGVVSIVWNGEKAVLLEVNAQTDFVTKNTEFQALVKQIENILLKNDFANSVEANELSENGKTIKQLTIEATAKIGEKIELRRTLPVNIKGKTLGAYVHNNNQIASLVLLEGGNNEVAKNVAMHVASMNPEYLDEKEVPEDTIAKLKEKISKANALKNKPENIKENIAKGMLKKALSEITLIDQEFVMEKMSVRQYLNQNNATALAMYRFEVGEGIEKKVSDFASEVKAQMKV